jgi:hypothetical protein
MNNRETFLEFITRDSGFGRTPWLFAGLAHVFGVSSITIGIIETPWAFLGLVAPVTLWIGTYMNYTGRWK